MTNVHFADLNWFIIQDLGSNPDQKVVQNASYHNMFVAREKEVSYRRQKRGVETVQTVPASISII